MIDDYFSPSLLEFCKQVTSWLTNRYTFIVKCIGFIWKQFEGFFVLSLVVGLFLLIQYRTDLPQIYYDWFWTWMLASLISIVVIIIESIRPLGKSLIDHILISFILAPILLIIEGSGVVEISFDLLFEGSQQQKCYINSNIIRQAIQDWRNRKLLDHVTDLIILYLYSEVTKLNIFLKLQLKLLNPSIFVILRLNINILKIIDLKTFIQKIIDSFRCLNFC